MIFPIRSCFLCNKNISAKSSTSNGYTVIAFFFCESCDASFEMTSDLSTLLNFSNYITINNQTYFTFIKFPDDTLSFYQNHTIFPTQNTLITTIPFNLPLNKTNLFNTYNRLIKLIIFS